MLLLSEYIIKYNELPGDVHSGCFVTAGDFLPGRYFLPTCDEREHILDAAIFHHIPGGRE